MERGEGGGLLCQYYSSYSKLIMKTSYKSLTKICMEISEGKKNRKGFDLCVPRKQYLHDIVLPNFCNFRKIIRIYLSERWIWIFIWPRLQCFQYLLTYSHMKTILLRGFHVNRTIVWGSVKSFNAGGGEDSKSLNDYRVNRFKDLYKLMSS